MKPSFIVTCLLLLILTSAYCQDEEQTFNSYHKNIYAEFLGSHILGGVNYDMRLKKGKMDGIGFRAGIGGLSASGYADNTNASLGIVTFPLEFNHLIGKKRSSFVSGIGLLPVYATVSADGELTNDEFIQAEGFGIVGGFMTIGYRFQPKKTGVMFQVNWNPLMIRKSGFMMGWFGLGVGIGFK
jgi:hypothetical protein